MRSTPVPDPPAARRPRSLAEMREARGRFDNRSGRERGLAFRPRADDVLIATAPKCGTTWVQQIVHGLRTRGSMDFAEITEAVPWLEMAAALGLDPEGEQAARPRAYKTHLTWEEIPKGGRYIHVTRDPRDVLVSQFRFHEGWWLEPGAVGIDEYARDQFLGPEPPGRFWTFLLSWWPRRRDPDVLFLAYEGMREDLGAALRRIAAFIGCPLDPALEAVVLRQSSIEFMRSHAGQFDDHPVRAVLDAACGLPPGSDSSKVRRGAVGEHAALVSPETVAALDRRWAATIGAANGLPDYPALRGRLAAENRATARRRA